MKTTCGSGPGRRHALDTPLASNVPRTPIPRTQVRVRIQVHVYSNVPRTPIPRTQVRVRIQVHVYSNVPRTPIPRTPSAPTCLAYSIMASN